MITMDLLSVISFLMGLFMSLATTFYCYEHGYLDDIDKSVKYLFIIILSSFWVVSIPILIVWMIKKMMTK